MAEFNEIKVGRKSHEVSGSFERLGVFINIKFGSEESIKVFDRYLIPDKKVNSIEFYCERGTTSFIGPFFVKQIESNKIILYRY